MVTRWTRQLLDEATALTTEKRYRSALGRLLMVLDVYPGLPEVQRLAGELIYIGARTTSEAAPEEQLGPRQLFDTRLNAVFCACEAPGCGVSWVSAHHLLGDHGGGVSISNPMGGRCDVCAVTVCRRHARPAALGLGCPRCGRHLDPVPAPNGRRHSAQTERLNKPLVHVIVLVEGKRPPSPDFMTGLCDSVMPDVFEDSPRITGNCSRRFRGDEGRTEAVFHAGALEPAYLTDDYDLRIHPGRQAGRRGQRWVIAKVFENRPKHVDPDNPAPQH
ncbi:hypothetical protein H0H10_21870 [Streptomyces sp. TRM S81-3]|uniref:Uncharacterized protein n=1 Tax=Streptomyces griseicoloratus TaxID=2752516 RepID=A0A926L5H1_9ACTN|nr:hypothetical protein [Streptomyces griseicoloratus]MBD0421769.1 hypothetical protein [Streptomyces griseicoloratus]